MVDAQECFLIRRAHPVYNMLADDMIITPDKAKTQQNIYFESFRSSCQHRHPVWPKLQNCWDLLAVENPSLDVDDILAQLIPQRDVVWVIWFQSMLFEEPLWRSALERGLATLDRNIAVRRKWIAKHSDENLSVLSLRLVVFAQDPIPDLSLSGCLMRSTSFQQETTYLLTYSRIANQLKPRETPRPQDKTQPILADRAHRAYVAPNWGQTNKWGLLLSGGPASGKTSLAKTFLRHAARQNYPILHVALEDEWGEHLTWVDDKPFKKSWAPQPPDPICITAGPLMQTVFGQFLAHLDGQDHHREDREDMWKDFQERIHQPKIKDFVQALLVSQIKTNSPDPSGYQLMMFADQFTDQEPSKFVRGQHIMVGKYLRLHAKDPWLADIMIGLEVASFIDACMDGVAVVCLDDAHVYSDAPIMNFLMESLLRKRGRGKVHLIASYQDQSDIPSYWLQLATHHYKAELDHYSFVNTKEDKSVAVHILS